MNIDSSMVVMNGPESGLGTVRHLRDFRDQSRPQVEFLTAELGTRILLYSRLRGQHIRPGQYRGALSDIFSMVWQGRRS